ncbi:MAG TPA: hypothetical protein VGB79_09365 [Allosphingosinicella sp.]|jgi:hypothetical protein
MAGTREDYEAKAAEALVQLESATSEADRQRLKRAHGCFLKLASHGEEAAARAAMRPAARIRPEKPAPAPVRSTSYFK